MECATPKFLETQVSSSPLQDPVRISRALMRSAKRCLARCVALALRLSPPPFPYCNKIIVCPFNWGLELTELAVVPPAGDRELVELAEGAKLTYWN